jgi:hypothetical protein
MPTTFSAATCITYNPGPVPAEGPFEIYLNNNYDVPPFIPYLTLGDVTGSQCPYIIEVPTGTTVINFKDKLTSYCISIPVQDNNICQTCNLGLSLYSASTSSVITAGVLTGSCQTPIVDYKINWYGPDSTTTLAFSSGSGIYANPASTYTHPLSGPGRSIPSTAGVYTPVIQNVTVNGYSYSNTGGTNNIPANFLNCLPTTNVLPLTCDVRTNPFNQWPYSAYTHYLSLDISSNSPQTIETTFKISADTKYLAWTFLGYDRPDRVMITLSGASYGTTKIGLEDIVIGSDNITTNLTPNIFPKSANTGNKAYYYRKITTLTGLTINNNDNIEIKVKPSISDTLWDLYITCLSDWECDDCFTQNTTRKIIGSSISGITASCNSNSIYYAVSGCSQSDTINSDFYTYYGFGGNYNSIDEYSTQNVINALYGDTLYNTRFSCAYQWCNYNFPICTEDSSKISYDKTFLIDGKGVFGFTGSSQVISSYYNNFVNTKSLCWVNGTLPTSIDYYKLIVMTIPSNNAPNNCGDFIGTRSINIYLHPTSTVVTGITGSQYYMKLTTNTITNQYRLTPYGSCAQNCDYYLTDYFVGFANNYSTGSTLNGYGTNRVFDITGTSKGIYYTNSTSAQYFTEGTSTYTIQSRNSYYRSSTSIGNTYPFSGDPGNPLSIIPSTIIPSFSGTVCNYNQSGSLSNYGSYQRFDHYNWEYESRLPNPSNNNDFEIWATPIVNGILTPPKVLAYRFSGGTATTINPTYITNT